MRVLQLIDSLRPGGAERMSVTYANALAKRIDASFLCCTRIEGLSKSLLSPEVGYLFLNKKSTLDLKAFLKLRKFVKKNKINLIQAHSSSWFLAVLVKLSLPGLKLVWHDHYGRELQERKLGSLKPASRLFDGIISVNANLKKWAEENLKSKNVRFFKNFLPLADKTTAEIKEKSPLKGEEGFRIICLANLRPQKDHLNLLKTFELVLKEHLEVSLHLIGKDEHDAYSASLKSFVANNKLHEKVFFYGEQENVEEFLMGADLGVLSSISEGLPVALLEYGRAGLPVVSTSVGECAEVLGSAGRLVPPQNPEALAKAINLYLKNDAKRMKDAASFHAIVIAAFSEEEIFPSLLKFYKIILENKN